MPPELTQNQKRVLTYFEQQIQQTGQSPSLREASADLGVSHAAVAQSLKTLEEKGWLRRQGRYSREIRLLKPGGVSGAGQWRAVPLVGRVAAGLPLYAQQEWESMVVLDRNLFKGENLFCLRVRGDSMKDAGILNNDLAVCEARQYAENNEIVVALVKGGDEATVKRFFLRKDHIELRPENPAFAPMKYPFGQILIQGKVKGILRGQEAFSS